MGEGVAEALASRGASHGFKAIIDNAKAMTVITVFK
jgi:hypothetical protein